VLLEEEYSAGITRKITSAAENIFAMSLMTKLTLKGPLHNYVTPKMAVFDPPCNAW